MPLLIVNALPCHSAGGQGTPRAAHIIISIYAGQADQICLCWAQCYACRVILDEEGVLKAISTID